MDREFILVVIYSNVFGEWDCLGCIFIVRIL